MRVTHTLVIAAMLGTLAPLPAVAQQTRADTAAVLIEAARRLAREGERDLAVNLLRHILRWYADTDEAREAARALEAADRARVAGNGRTSFVVTNTLFGAWLGVAVPTAFGVHDPSPYGAGLIAGPGIGVLWSLLYSGAHPMTSGQSAAYRWSLIWSSWQAFGWREVLGIGNPKDCYEDPLGGTSCYEGDSDTARWAALVAGGIAGAGAGLVLTHLDLPAGDVAVVQDASMWGTWFGLVGSVLANEDASDDATYTWMLVTGNAALLAGIPLARSWRPSVGRVRIITIAGIAGALVGVGLDLLANVDDERTAISLPALGSGVGLGVGVVLTARGGTGHGFGDGGTASGAFLRLGRGATTIGAPMPEPRALPASLPDGTMGRRPGLGVRLIEVRF